MNHLGEDTARPGLFERGIVVTGAGPVGLITALGLSKYGIPVTVLEREPGLSTETKAGTVLTRTLEVLDRYGALESVLAHALRVDEIGEIERRTNRRTQSVLTSQLAEDTRFPFVVNIPQNELEARLASVLEERSPGAIRFGCRVVGFEQHEDGVAVQVVGPNGPETLEADILLGADGGRSTVRELLGVTVDGFTLEDRYMLVDLNVDLDLANPRDYPYLAYFSDPDEWMILVRQPHAWRFLYRLQTGAPEPTVDDLRAKALRFIGDVDEIEVLGANVYSVHHRVASNWHDRNVFLVGDAAHLITPMWALGLNTGALDASNLPWRLAWVHRRWAERAILDGYEREQAPVAIHGTGQMAEEARKAMGRPGPHPTQGHPVARWGEAYTRTLLGVRLDIDGSGQWSLVHDGDAPGRVRIGDRAPDVPLYGPDGRTTSMHQLASDVFIAVHFADARRSPVRTVSDLPGLRHVVVSRWDAPLNTEARSWSYLDPGDRARRRFGVDEGATVLIRPDGHIARIFSSAGSEDRVADADAAYLAITRPNTPRRDAA